MYVVYNVFHSFVGNSARHKFTNELLRKTEYKHRQIVAKLLIENCGKNINRKNKKKLWFDISMKRTGKKTFPCQ